jgi:hypothetical protein
MAARLESRVAIDLGKLAIVRCDEGFQSVAQLLSGAESYGLAIGLICHFIERAAVSMQDGMEAQNGTRPQYHRCLSHTLAEVLDALEISYEISDKKKK